MNNSEDFDERTQQEEQSAAEKSEALPRAGENGMAVPPVATDIFSINGANGQNPPYWYGVSYQNQDVRDGTQCARRSRKVRPALIAVCVVACVLLCAIAGYVGASLYNMSREDLPPHKDTPPTVGDPTGSDGGLGLGDEIFGASGNAGYDYAAAALDKNDGSTLADSDNGSAGSLAMSKIDVVAKVKNSVVEITTTTTSNYGTMTAGAGSGVIIHADGIIVTNNHVIEGASKVYVRLTNGNTYEASVRGTDEDGDIAVIKIDPKETLTVAKLGYSGALVEGEEVLAIGNPLGELGGTVTDGIISQVEREISVDGMTMTLLQTNAAINSGNSGGGLFNMAGELIGVVNAKYSAAGVEGLGFAIPVDTAVISVNHLLKLGYIPDVPSLGIELAEGTVRNGFYYRQVVYVYDAGTNGDFKYQDIFISVDGVGVSTLSELKQVVRRHSVGDEITVVVSRNGTEVEIDVTLVEYIPKGTV